MLQKERHEKMLAKLNIEGSIRVRDIAKEYNVTEDCIRKDLAILEKEGKLKRIHGGATVARENPHIYTVNDRKNKYIEEKKLIASKAIELIKPNSMVFLGISTSNIEIAKLIYERQMNVTVVTNMIDIMQIFLQDFPGKLIFIGGGLNGPRDGFVGSITNEILQDYQFDLAFIGAVGVDINQNKITTYEIEDAITKKCAIRSSMKKYLVAESVKFDQDGNVICAKLEDIDGIITDKEIIGKQKDILNEKGLEII